MPLYNPKQKKIEIKLYWKEQKTKGGYLKPVIIPDEEALKQIEANQESQKPAKEGEPAKEIKPVPPENEVYCLTTYWKSLNWKDNNAITEKASFYNQMEAFYDVNVWKYRDLKLKNCLLEWDLKDPEDPKKILPVDEKIINDLPTEVITALLARYEAAISLSEEDKKK